MSPTYGYTVLTHEAIIDSVWDASIQKKYRCWIDERGAFNET